MSISHQIHIEVATVNKTMFRQHIKLSLNINSIKFLLDKRVEKLIVTAIDKRKNNRRSVYWLGVENGVRISGILLLQNDIHQ